MLVGQLPFNADDTPSIIKLVFAGFNKDHIKTLKAHNVSILARRMIERCLLPNSKQRITANQIVMNPWFFSVPIKDNTSKTKEQVFQTMHDKYLTKYSTRAIEHTVQARPYGRVAGLYRILNTEMDEKVVNEESSRRQETKAQPFEKKSVRFNFV